MLDAYVFYLYETFTSSLFTLTSYFKYGGVAQLGERLTGSQEVMGSIPTVSTKKCKSKDLHFFIHCESNGISSAVRLYIITRSVYIINRRLHKRFRNDDIQRLAPLMICNSNGIDDIHGSAVIFDIVPLVRFALAEHEGHIIGEFAKQMRGTCFVNTCSTEFRIRCNIEYSGCFYLCNLRYSGSFVTFPLKTGLHSILGYFFIKCS